MVDFPTMYLKAAKVGQEIQDSNSSFGSAKVGGWNPTAYQRSPKQLAGDLTTNSTPFKLEFKGRRRLIAHSSQVLRLDGGTRS